MAKKTQNVAYTSSSLCGTPRRYRKNVHIEREINPTLQQFAVPLGRQLVGQQLDGVNLSNGSLLSRQYDDEFGKVDPASDIHTDHHLLQDALMRDYRSGLVSQQNSDTNTNQN